MSADILLYDSTHVTLGEDQKKHIEARCKKLKLTNIEVITCDMNEFDIDKNQIDREMGYENFAVNLFTFQSLEILYLKRAGHRRAIFEWHNNDIKKNWLIP